MQRWLLTDLHIHTTFSDGLLSLQEVVQLYGENGFDTIAITDHLFDTESARGLELLNEGKSVVNVHAYLKEIEEISHWAKDTYDLLVIPGLEICNLERDFHILGIDLKDEINPNQEAKGIIKEIHRQGGLAIASHPYLKLSFFLQEDSLSIQRHPLHLWKYRNSYINHIDAWEIANREDLFEMVGLERFPYIANSDFHERSHLTSWKSLIFSEKNREKIKEAIRTQRVAIFFYHYSQKKDVIGSVRPIRERVRCGGQIMDQFKGALILVVDDERDLVEMLSYNLEKKGFQVLKAYDGFEAWQKIETEKPNLIILDLMMPGLDGWEICRMLRRSGDKTIRNINILMLTAKSMPEDRIYGLEIGADDYLTKPFSLNELILRVSKLIQKQRITSQLLEQMEILNKTTEKKTSDLQRLIHDLKTPLISIGCSAKRMVRRCEDEELSQILKGIYEQTLRLTQWVDQTLSSTHREEIMESSDIVTLLQQAIDLLEESFEEKSIEIQFQPPSYIPPVRCYKQLMVRVFVNLLANSLKYTPKGGKVKISLHTYFSKQGTGVLEIVFKDTGVGICEEDRAKIFEPFYRGKNVSLVEGDGLGLTFVKEVIDLHKGKILVESEQNLGSVFSILLPLKGSSI